MADSDPISDLTSIGAKMDSLSRYISESINLQAPLSTHFTSSQISTAINQIILAGTSLITPPTSDLVDSDIVEIDASEILADRVHVCQICGKAFKRDANLRMHMRAHGERFKSVEALAGPNRPRSVRFSCPSSGCSRNRGHRDFRPLKSAVSARVHFKRRHCPKMYGCDRCESKRFSVLADLKSHRRRCGEAAKWRCSCGTSFSRKDKLFGHVALFEGHMPLPSGDCDRKRLNENEEVDFDGFLDGFDAFD